MRPRGSGRSIPRRAAWSRYRRSGRWASGPVARRARRRQSKLHDIRLDAHAETTQLSGVRANRARQLAGELADALAHCERLTFIVEGDLRAERPAGGQQLGRPLSRKVGSAGGLVSLECSVEGGAVDVEGVGDVVGVHAGGQ